MSEPPGTVASGSRDGSGPRAGERKEGSVVLGMTQLLAGSLGDTGAGWGMGPQECNCRLSTWRDDLEETSG